MEQVPIVLSDDLLRLSGVLRPCVGPLCKQYLLVTRTLNKVVVTGSGRSVLRHTLKADADTANSPLVRLAMGPVGKHEQSFGDGTASLVLMIAEGLREAKRLTGGRAPQMLALSQDLSSVRSRWLDQVVVPHLAAQSLRVGEHPTSKPVDSPSRATGSGEARSSPTFTPRAMQKTRPPSQAGDPHKQLSGCSSQRVCGKPDHLLAAKAAEAEGAAKWRKHGEETANAQFGAPFRDKQRIGNTSDITFETSKRRCDSPNIDAYLERLRAILGTAVGGLFSPQACHLLVELVVNWIASTAQQVRRRLSTLQSSSGSDTAAPSNSIIGGGGERGWGKRSKDWGEPRRCLVEAVRFLRRHEGTLILKAKGAGLAESVIVDDGVVLPYGLIGAFPEIRRKRHVAEKGCFRFVVLKCPVEPSSLSPSDGYHTRVTVGVTNASQHVELLRHRGRTMQAVVDALVAANIDLVACTHPLKHPFPDLLREARIAGLERIETQDADYLAQRFGAQAFHRVTGKDTFSNGALGAVGLARGARRLCLGQGLQSKFCFVYGNGRRQCDDRLRTGVSAQNLSTPVLERAVEGALAGLACQAVLRAPSDGILVEYANCVSTCLTLTHKWLTWDPPTDRGGSVDPDSFSQCHRSGMPLCPVVAGGGASELCVSLLFRELAARCRDLEGSTCAGDCARTGLVKGETGALGAVCSCARGRSPAAGGKPWLPVTGGIDSCGGATDRAVRRALSSGGNLGRGRMSKAFDILQAATAVIPRVLMENASSHSGLNPSPSPQERLNGNQPSTRLRLEHTLESLQADGLHSAGLVVRTGAFEDESSDTRCSWGGVEPMVTLSCGLKAGVVHPLAVKHGMLVALLDAMITSLRVGGVVRCRGRFSGRLRAGEASGEGDGGSGEDE